MDAANQTLKALNIILVKLVIIMAVVQFMSTAFHAAYNQIRLDIYKCIYLSFTQVN